MVNASIFTQVSDFLWSALNRLPTRAGRMAGLFHNFKFTPFRIGFGALLLWVAVVRSVRWRRYKEIHRKYEGKWNNGKGKLSPEEAQIVVHGSMYYDMPLLLNYALAFALFKTYAIPSISSLLVATKQLSSHETISRRYADTEILISTWVTCPVSGFLDPEAAEKNRALGKDAQPAEDPRAMIALARTNWIHSHYKISNDDYLYTLCLFILEPLAWARKYGWRKHSPLEEYAFYTFWADIGRKMEIKDIPENLEELSAWSKQYEQIYMVPAESNKETARYTVEELLAAAPKAFGIWNFGERIVICLMEDIVRKAMMYPKQPWIYHAITKVTMSSVAFVQGWLLPPRIHRKTVVDARIRTNSDFANGVCPRLHPYKWQPKPWYRPEPSRLGYYREKLLVAVGWYAEMPGSHLRSSGYRIEEMGAFQFENLAHEEIMQKAAELQGCPVAGPWSLEYKSKGQ